MQPRFLWLTPLLILQVTAMGFRCQGVSGGVDRKLVEPEWGKLAEAIYQAEGGAGTRWPYGVKLERLRAQGLSPSRRREEARLACIATCRRKWLQWQETGRKQAYLDYLADRYCPSSADWQGNRNWKRNVRLLYQEASR